MKKLLFCVVVKHYCVGFLFGGESIVTRRVASLEALAMNDGRTRLVVLLLRDPHLLERRQRRQDRAANPHRVLAFRRRNDLDLHRRRCQRYATTRERERERENDRQNTFRNQSNQSNQSIKSINQSYPSTPSAFCRQCQGTSSNRPTAPCCRRDPCECRRRTS